MAYITSQKKSLGTDTPEFRRAYAAAKHDWDGGLWNSYTWGTRFPDLPKA